MLFEAAGRTGAFGLFEWMKEAVNMQKIASFQVDHTTLQKGVYVSRIDGDVITYDIRMRRPNLEPVMRNGAIHTIEHLFATYVRNSDRAHGVIYFGPMGCRTGFYFLTRNLGDEASLQLIKEAFAFIAEYNGEIPGASAAECGNYLDHDLPGAVQEARDFCKVLERVTVEMLDYNYTK